MQISEEITKCRICESVSLVDVLDLGEQPPANHLRKNVDDEVHFIPLKLVFCRDCSTIQISHTVNPGYLFSHYVWVTGTSSTAHEYAKTFRDRVLDRVDTSVDAEVPFIVEVASNDGTFLKEFQQSDCRVLGIDPAENIAKIAQDNGVPTRADFFNKTVADEVRTEHGGASVAIARNVIPHVKEVHSIIEGMADLIGEQGLGVIEFHYAKNIVDELHYDSVYHEHLFYFSLQTLGGLLKRHNLSIFDVERSPISGGSLVIYFSQTPRAKSAALIELEGQEKSLGLNDLETWLEFSQSCQSHAKTFVDMVKEARNSGRVVGYGASARSSTLLNFCDLDKSDLDFVIDKNELKHGFVTPGSDIPIVPLDGDKAQFDDVSAVVMLAWNFEKEIEKELRGLGYTGSIIMPLPNAPRII